MIKIFQLTAKHSERHTIILYKLQIKTQSSLISSKIMFYLFLIVFFFFILFYVLFHFNEKFGKSVDGENKNFKTLIFRGQDL